jgi:hypothetical protein
MPKEETPRYQICITHSQSSADKLWVTVINLDDGSEFAVGFKDTDCNEILQVNETLFSQLTTKERADPRIEEGRAALVLLKIYPKHFVFDPEEGAMVCSIAYAPTEYVAPVHLKKTFATNSDVRQWWGYKLISNFSAEDSEEELIDERDERDEDEGSYDEEALDDYSEEH